MNIEQRLKRTVFVCALLFALNIVADDASSSIGPNDTWVDPLDTTEEDLVIPSLQSGQAKDEQADPKFVAFLADIGGRLTLPQTYHSGIKDLSVSLANDQMWKNDPTMRRAMLSLLHRAEVYARRNGGEDLPVVDGLVKEAFEMWPPGPDRTRIVGLMNSVASFHDRQAALAQAAKDKSDKAAAKEAEKQKAAQEKVVAKQAAAEAAAAQAPAASKPRVPARSSGGARPRKASATPSGPDVSVSDGSSVASDDAASVTTRSPRARKRLQVENADAQSAPDIVVPDAAPAFVVPERIDHLPNIVVPAPVVASSGDGTPSASTSDVSASSAPGTASIAAQ